MIAAKANNSGIFQPSHRGITLCFFLNCKWHYLLLFPLEIEKTKGSIEVGKDADFLVFDNDLLTAEHEGFSNNLPEEIYFSGKKMDR